MDSSSNSDNPDSKSPWEQMARELAANPDSPASLRIRSAISHAMAPTSAAIQQLEAAIALQLSNPGPAADAAFEAAKTHYERACHGELDPGVEKDLRRAAQDNQARRRVGPPALEAILSGVEGRTDVGYDHGIHMQGLRGIWHRLWAMLKLGTEMGEDQEHWETMADMRAQFEGVLGRQMTGEEWDTLVAHARAAAART